MPPYSYVPGKFPHPLRDPRGHSHGVELPRATPPDVDQWQDCEPYLWGIDLFNHGFYWEAHESWEAVWQALGRHGVLANFFKALIKLAAAGVKAREGRAAGVQRHARRAAELLACVAQQRGPHGQHLLGLSLPMLREHANQLADAPHSVLNDSQQPVVVVLLFTISPALPV